MRDDYEEYRALLAESGHSMAPLSPLLWGRLDNEARFMTLRPLRQQCAQAPSQEARRDPTWGTF